MGGYTPGPWVYSPARHTHDSMIHQDIPTDRYGYYGPDSGGVVGSSEWLWLKDEDARLIAAAPELLSELESVRDWLALLAIASAEDVMQGGPAMFESVSAAIRKATEAAS